MKIKKWKVEWRSGCFVSEKRFLFKKNAEKFIGTIKGWKRLTKEIEK